MASVDSQPTWVPYPYEVTKDCSQGFCSIYCPQRCYSIFSPPPTPVFDFSDGSSSSPSSSAFSPLLIAIIGILATAFLLVSYYTIVSKYCGSFESLLRRQQRNGGGSGEDDTGGDGQLRHNEVWRASVSDGLEESVIRSITVCKYKKGDGFVDGTDCSVCLAEFREEEYLRLLPKCSHAFHVQCIDAWLKSHSNCPLCRSIVVSPATVLPPVLLTTSPEPEDVNRQVGDETATVIDINDVERRVEEQEDRVLPKGQGTVLISVDEGLGHRGDVVDVRGEDRVEAIRRRSASMDEAACQERISIADVLEMDMEGNGCAFSGGTAGSSRSSGLQDSSVLRRSFSGGRLHFLKNHHRHGNGNSAARSVASVDMIMLMPCDR